MNSSLFPKNQPLRFSEMGCKDTDFFIPCKFFRDFFSNIFAGMEVYDR